MVGQPATFTVAAESPKPVRYQWLKGGAPISGATASSYTTPPTTATDNGSQFSVMVSNSGKKITSLAAMLTVNAATDVLTYHNDNARTGQNVTEGILTLGNVTSAQFGKLGFFPVDGLVDAQPLYVSNVAVPGMGTHNLLIVGTENDSVYAIDADSGATIWHASMLNANEFPTPDPSCCNWPAIGVNATPVIDRGIGPNGTIYVVASSSGSQNGSLTYYQRVHALDLALGTELFGGPVDVQATYPGTGDNSNGTNVIFDPAQYRERCSLLLLNGVIYTTWASHYDVRPYTGWVIGYSETTLAQTSVMNVTPNADEGAIWMSGAGPAADSSGNIYFLDANGQFDEDLDANGFPSHGNYGNAFIKLSTSGNKLAVADYFELNSESQENENDIDLGSGGEMLLPDLADGSGHIMHLAVGAGKDTNLYVVNRDSMGKFTEDNSGIYQMLAGVLPGGIWSSPAYFNNTVYYTPVRGPIEAFTISNAKLSSAPSTQTATTFSYPGATPSISAKGTSNGIIWAVEWSNIGVVHAYNAANLNELYNSNQAAAARDQFGPSNKFVTPTVVNGRLFIGTPSGVAVFGLLP